MKMIALVLRVLVGLPFLVFGADYFLHFIPIEHPSIPEVAQQFGGGLM